MQHKTLFKLVNLLCLIQFSISHYFDFQPKLIISNIANADDYDYFILTRPIYFDSLDSEQNAGFCYSANKTLYDSSCATFTQNLSTIKTIWITSVSLTQLKDGCKQVSSYKPPNAILFAQDVTFPNLCIDQTQQIPYAYISPTNSTAQLINKYLLKDSNYGRIVYTSYINGIDCRIINVRDFILYALLALYTLSFILMACLQCKIRRIRKVMQSQSRIVQDDPNNQIQIPSNFILWIFTLQYINIMISLLIKSQVNQNEKALLFNFLIAFFNALLELSIDIFFINISCKFDLTGNNLKATILQVLLCFMLFFFYVSTYIGFSVSIIRLLAIVLFSIYSVVFFLELICHCKSDTTNKKQKGIDITNSIFSIIYYGIEIAVCCVLQYNLISINNSSFHCMLTGGNVGKTCLVFLILPIMWLIFIRNKDNKVVAYQQNVELAETQFYSYQKSYGLDTARSQTAYGSRYL